MSTRAPFNSEPIVDKLSAVELQSTLSELMKMKDGVQPRGEGETMQRAEALERIEVSFEYCRDNLDEIIEAIKFALLMVYIKEENKKSALDMIKNGVKTLSTPEGRAEALQYAIISKMKAVICELLRHNGPPTEYCFLTLDVVLKGQPQPISEAWENIKEMMIEKLLTCNEPATADTLSILMTWKPTRVKEVLEAIDINKSDVDDHIYFIHYHLLSCDSECFQIFLQKFSQSIDYLKMWETECFAMAIVASFDRHSNMDRIISNIDVLLKSGILSKKEIDELNKRNSRGFYTELLSESFYKANKIPSDQFAQLADFLQNSGFPITTHGMDDIFQHFGYESAFKRLLLKPLTLDLSTKSKSFARFYYDPKWTLESALKDIEDFVNDKHYMEHLLGFFAHPKVRELAVSSDISSVALQGQHLPQIPSLVELARNTCRKHIVKQVSNSQQFHTEVNRLPIPRICAKTLLLEKRIYNLDYQTY